MKVWAPVALAWVCANLVRPLSKMGHAHANAVPGQVLGRHEDASGASDCL